MEKPRSKILGITLVAAATALLGWVLYEPASLIATLHLNRQVSEAVVVLAALTIVGLGFAAGSVCLSGAQAARH